MYMDMYEMVFPVWYTDETVIGQAEKIIEEVNEVKEASRTDDTDYLIDECLDAIQASLNLIYKVAPECNLQTAIMRNFMKNKRRGYIPQS